MSLLSEALGASPGGPGGQTQGRGHEPLAQVASGPHPHPHLSPQESPAQDAQQPRPASSSGGRAPGLDQAQSRVWGLSPWPEDLLPQKQAWNSHDTPGHRRFLGTRPGAVSPPPRAPHPAPQLPAPPQLLGFPAGWGVLGRPPAHPHRTLGISTTGPCRQSCAHPWTAWGSGGRAVSARALWDPREAPGRPHACSGGTAAPRHPGLRGRTPASQPQVWAGPLLLLPPGDVRLAPRTGRHARPHGPSRHAHWGRPQCPSRLRTRVRAPDGGSELSPRPGVGRGAGSPAATCSGRGSGASQAGPHLGESPPADGGAPGPQGREEGRLASSWPPEPPGRSAQPGGRCEDKACGAHEGGVESSSLAPRPRRPPHQTALLSQGEAGPPGVGARASRGGGVSMVRAGPAPVFPRCQHTWRGPLSSVGT